MLHLQLETADETVNYKTKKLPAMKLSKIEKKLMSVMKSEISENALAANFEEQLEFIEIKSKGLAKIEIDHTAYFFLMQCFESLKREKGNIDTLVAKYEHIGSFGFVNVNFDINEYDSLKSLCEIVLGASIQAYLDRHDKLSFKIERLSKIDHFKSIASIINYQGDLPENVSKENQLEEDQLCENPEIGYPNEIQNVNDDRNDSGDLYDDIHDNFYYNYDADEIDDNTTVWSGVENKLLAAFW